MKAEVFLVLLATVLAISLCIISCTQQEPTPEVTHPWLPGYSYCKEITINGSTAGNQTNYQMRLLLGQSSGASGENVDCGGHCNSDFTDVRSTKMEVMTRN